MRLAEQWTEIRPKLGLDWAGAQLTLTADASQCDRAALVLGPAAPRREGNRFHLQVTRGGEQLGTTPTLLERMLARLDREGIRGTLELDEPDDASGAAVTGPSLAAEWELLERRLPDDWSHLYGEVELDSSDFVERAALLMSPMNPARFGDATALRFRCAHRIGYGVSAGMAGRCLARLDAEGITGRVRVLRVVSEDRPIGTQGPVWRMAGRSV
jgi:hypothetical protein